MTDHRCPGPTAARLGVVPVTRISVADDGTGPRIIEVVDVPLRDLPWRDDNRDARTHAHQTPELAAPPVSGTPAPPAPRTPGAASEAPTHRHPDEDSHVTTQPPLTRRQTAALIVLAEGPAVAHPSAGDRHIDHQVGSVLVDLGLAIADRTSNGYPAFRITPAGHDHLHPGQPPKPTMTVAPPGRGVQAFRGRNGTARGRS